MKKLSDQNLKIYLEGLFRKADALSLDATECEDLADFLVTRGLVRSENVLIDSEDEKKQGPEPA